ncbi:hypothetical protein [Comamonas testosteroni]|uniref:hypothetical protein n=1 Tax=Comamonas testosteroni TaxID=285 RepID=UPI001E64EAD8|nr:hypothetical protein [Comamonas testosteroni]WEE80491.1 hypothetical protein LZ683_19830 [Comamonas testosteroni]
MRHEAGQLVNVLALVACGLGVAIVPASFAMFHREQIVFRPLRASRQVSRLAVLVSAQALKSNPMLELVAQLAQSQLQALAAQLAQQGTTASRLQPV